MSEYGYITHSELMHHGVKGQKWGIRRYQNEDGSYKTGSEGRYYHPIRSLMSKLHRAKRSGVAIGDKTIGGVRAKSQIKRAKYQEDRKELIENKLLGTKDKTSGKEKKIVDKNSYAYKKAKYDRAAAITTSAITAASIVGMGALMGSKAIKNKKAAQNAMLKLVDNKIGGTSIKGVRNAYATLSNKNDFKTANARAFLKNTLSSTSTKPDRAATMLFNKNDPYRIGRNGYDHARAQLLKKKKR